MRLESTVRATGSSITVTIPKAVVDAYGLEPGTRVFWVDDPTGGFRLLPSEPDQLLMLERAEHIVDEYAPVFARLAREEH